MTELLVQITDRFGKIVGSAAMLEAFEKQLIRRTVYVMLVDEKGQFLLQKRSANVPNYPSYWDASAGGHVDEGEAPEVAAYRELEEELGVTDVTLSHVTDFYFESDGDGRTYKYYAHIYTSKWFAGELLHDSSDEVEVARLYARSEIDQLDEVTPLTRYIVSLL